MSHRCTTERWATQFGYAAKEKESLTSTDCSRILLSAMSMTVFPIDLATQLRRRVADAAHVSEVFRDGPAGWSISPIDLARVVAVFGRLRPKPGYLLGAYQFRAGGNGNGFVYAMPPGKTLPPPEECPHDNTLFLEPPVPVHALSDIMGAIEGDGSPLAYLQASLLKREFAEFGAMWHGCKWGTHTILGKDPFSARGKDEEDFAMDRPSGQTDDWEWKRPKPKQWAPTVSMTASRIRCAFYTFTGLGEERILRHTDAYLPGEYSSTTRTYLSAVGGGGYLF